MPDRLLAAAAPPLAVEDPVGRRPGAPDLVDPLVGDDLDQLPPFGVELPHALDQLDRGAAPPAVHPADHAVVDHPPPSPVVRRSEPIVPAGRAAGIREDPDLRPGSRLASGAAP